MTERAVIPFADHELYALMGGHRQPNRDADPVGWKSYARILYERMYDVDEDRANDNFLLEIGPPGILAAWDVLCNEETRRRGASHPRE